MSQLHEITGPQYFGTSKKKSCIEDGDKTLPGPGAHTPIPMSKIAIPQWKIGNSTSRDEFLDPHLAKHPSPQHYQVNHQIVEKVSKKAVIPQSVYKPKSTNDNLSGFHQINTTFTKTSYPEYSFAYSQEHDYSTLVPGPGSYQINNKTISFNKTQKGFSTSERPPPYGEEGKFPPPGKYSTISFGETAKYSFGKALRERCASKDPPSRFYDLQPKKPVVKLGRGSSTQYRREPTFLTANQYPAPGTYNNLMPLKIPNGIIQASQRKPIQHVEIVSYPSPDKYSAHQDFNRGQTFYKQKRHLEANQNGIPGPGTYTSKDSLSKIGSIFSKEKGLQKSKVVLPGASSYNPKDEITRRKINSTLVLRSNRVDFSKTITGIIGPGEYNIDKHERGQLGVISKSPRAKNNSPTNTPGVGNYNIPNFIGQLPKYCTSPKKINELGFSTFHQKMKHRLLHQQRKRKMESQKQSEKESIDLGNNPESKME